MGVEKNQDLHLDFRLEALDKGVSLFWKRIVLETTRFGGYKWEPELDDRGSVLAKSRCLLHVQGE